MKNWFIGMAAALLWILFFLVVVIALEVAAEEDIKVNEVWHIKCLV